MKKLVYLSLVMALGITSYETGAMGRLKKTLAQGVATRAAAGQDVPVDVEKLINDPTVMSKLSVEEQVNNYIAAGNKYFTGNWSEVFRTSGVTVPIARLMSRVNWNASDKTAALLRDAFAGGATVAAGASSPISWYFSNSLFMGYHTGFADDWQKPTSFKGLDEILTYLETLNFAEGQINTVQRPQAGVPSITLIDINNNDRLSIMGALYAVSKGLGIPNQYGNAQAATSDAELIGPIGGVRVSPWNSQPTDEQKLRAAKLYLKIAKTLK